MKRQLMRIVSLLLALTMLTGCNVNVSSGGMESSEETGSKKQYSIEEKTVPFYLQDTEHKEDITLYYVDESGVPYISMDTVLDLMQNLHEEDLYELEYDDDHAIFTRKGTKLTCDFDFENDTITFFDYDAFLKGDVGPIVNVGIPDQGSAAALFKEEDAFSLDETKSKSDQHTLLECHVELNMHNRLTKKPLPPIPYSQTVVDCLLLANTYPLDRGYVSLSESS